MKELEKVYSPSEIEKKWYKYWKILSILQQL